MFEKNNLQVKIMIIIIFINDHFILTKTFENRKLKKTGDTKPLRVEDTKNNNTIMISLQPILHTYNIHHQTFVYTHTHTYGQ